MFVEFLFNDWTSIENIANIKLENSNSKFVDYWLINFVLKLIRGIENSLINNWNKFFIVINYILSSHCTRINNSAHRFAIRYIIRYGTLVGAKVEWSNIDDYDHARLHNEIKQLNISYYNFNCTAVEKKHTHTHYFYSFFFFSFQTRWIITSINHLFNLFYYFSIHTYYILRFIIRCQKSHKTFFTFVNF